MACLILAGPQLQDVYCSTRKPALSALQGLTLDTAALAHALSFIPLHQVLGLDHKYCPDEPHGFESSSASRETHAEVPQHPSAASSVSKPGPSGQIMDAAASQVRQSKAAPAGSQHLPEPAQAAAHPGNANSVPATPPKHRAPEPVVRPETPSQQQPAPVPQGPAGSPSSQHRAVGAPGISSRQATPDSSLSSKPQSVPPAKPSQAAERKAARKPAHPAISHPANHPAAVKNASAALKPAPIPGGGLSEDDELDALLGLGSSPKPIANASRAKAVSEDEDLDALLGLDSSPKPRSVPKQSRNAKSAVQKPHANDIESFLDSL